jgi:F1F0 ATPase subunit 2
MSEPARLVISFVTGIVLGAIYFGGLWQTVRRLPDSGRPFASLFWSFLVRVSLVLAGFYLVMGGQWILLVAALFGFMITREWIVRRLGRRGS